MKISPRLAWILLLAAFLLHPALSSAVTLGQIDTFQDGTTQNWQVGFPGIPPVNVATGGPAGDGDHYLLLNADGGPGPDGRLSVFNQVQWSGNYMATGVNAITMYVQNPGATDLYLRLFIGDGAGRNALNSAVSTNPLFLPAGSGWTSVVFPISPKNLTPIAGSVQIALADAFELRIFHNPAASFPPPIVLASLGVDNITATKRTPLPFLPLLLLDN